MPYLSDIMRSSLSLVLVVSALTGLSSACGPVAITPQPVSPEREARVTLLNKSREMHVLRIREVRDGVQLDCDILEDAPSDYLGDEIFGASVRWTLYSDQELGLGTGNNTGWGDTDDLDGRDCNAVLVQSDTVADIVVYWDQSLEPKTFEFDADIPEYIEPDEQTVVLKADYSQVTEQLKPYRFRPCGEMRTCGPEAEEEASEIPAGARYYWETQFERPLHHRRESLRDERPQAVPPRCEMPGAGQALAWETPPRGYWRVEKIDRGVDGCHTLRLQRAETGQPHEQLICAPFEALAGLDGEAPDTSPATISFEELQNPEYEGLRLSADFRLTDGSVEGISQIYLTAGRSLPVTLPVDLETSPREGCGPVAAACGQADIPVDALVNLAADGDQPLRPGESTALSLRDSHFYLVRALQRPVLDPQCDDERVANLLSGRNGPYFEAVTVIRN